MTEDKTLRNFIQVSCNWAITNNKCYADAITTMPLSVASERISLDDIISSDTCISLHSMEQEIEPCKFDIKITNCQKISRIVVLSEAYVLEVFKQYGEYANTVFAELVDEFEGNFVYLADVALNPPTNETSINFTKTKSTQPMVWIYGIKLILTEPVKVNESEMLDYTMTNFLVNLNGSTQQKRNIANKLLEMITNQKENNTDDHNEDIKRDDIICKEDSTNLEITDIKTYINNKFHDMEERIMHRLDEIEQNMNKKLDTILEKLSLIIIQ